MSDLATLETRLTEAEAAYHQVMIQKKAASLSFGSGKSVSYTQANIDELRRYISDLKNQIAALKGTKGRGPVRFIF